MNYENNHHLPKELLKPYDPAASEPVINDAWEQSGLFNPDTAIAQGFVSPDAEHFSIVLPPPNVTGTLHTGHALMIVIQDIMVRYQRMLGKRTLWIPGTDHAAIATQSKVEKLLEKEGVKKHDLGREAFLKRVEQFAQDSHDTIVHQARKMGASLDWSREAYTLDEKRNLAVRTAFKKMYDDGLIYRKYRVINWDPKGQTVISDDEIVYEERDAVLYTFKYWNDFPISISTTRPETKVGDAAVAVHPDDVRYQQYIGKTFTGNFCGVNLTIKIIADRGVDPLFGTGALGVTPAHSKVDWDMAIKNNLPVEPVINEYAKMTVGGELLMGKKTSEAREIVAQWIRDNNLMESEETIKQNVSTAERTGAIIEPLPKLQWFIDVNKPIAARDNKSLKELMLDAVNVHGLTILPERFEKTYFHWTNNLQDWCISRQIWFGHRIPVWFCYDCNKKNQLNKLREIYENHNIDASEIERRIKEANDAFDKEETFTQLRDDINNGRKSIPEYFDLIVSENTPIHCPHCNKDKLIQDSDSLDTWFSSGLWTFSTLRWPEQTTDLATYHPTSVLETGYDILPFWVAKMIMMSTYLMGEIPFKTVYLHGMVRTANGQKMSKSLGNAAIDPLDIIAKYGNDALRMAMIIGNTPGNDLKLDENDIRGYGKFANKIWNASRFVLENIADLDLSEPIDRASLTAEDAADLDALHNMIATVTKEMNEFKYSLAGEKLYHYFWHTFADVIIERCKKIISESDNSDVRISAKRSLYIQLETLMRALHPFMPFITEKIWGLMPHLEIDATRNKKLLIIESWPKSR